MVCSAFPSRYTPSTGRPEIAEKNLSSFGVGSRMRFMQKQDFSSRLRKKRKQKTVRNYLQEYHRRCVQKFNAMDFQFQVHLHPRRGWLGGILWYLYIDVDILSKLILFDMRIIDISLCSISIQLLYLQLLACFIQMDVLLEMIIALIPWYHHFINNVSLHETRWKRTDPQCHAGPHDFKEWRLCMEPWQQLVMLSQLLHWQRVLPAVWCWFLHTWKLFYIWFVSRNPCLAIQTDLFGEDFYRHTSRKSSDLPSKMISRHLPK